MWMCRGQETGHAAATSFTAHADRTSPQQLCTWRLSAQDRNMARFQMVGRGAAQHYATVDDSIKLILDCRKGTYLIFIISCY